MSDQSPARIRVLVADDHPLFAESICLLLSADPRVEAVGVAQNGAEAVELAHELEPDVVLMDVHMPRLDGVEATRRLTASMPHVRVVMLSSSSAVEDVAGAHAAGACAYVTKDESAATIVRAVVEAAGAAVPLTAARAA